MAEMMVDGPAWTGEGLEESAGRYPLRVESAVFRLVDHLLPGIITTTRQARMYGLHALAWAEADEKGLTLDEASSFVRRCEVVLAGVHQFHHPHRIELSSAHGEIRIPLFIGDKGLNVERAARPGGLSAAGFGDVYIGPAIKVGLLSPDWPPREGASADLGALREGLGDVLALAKRDVIPISELQAADHLCLCAGPTAPDCDSVRQALFETIEEGRSDDRYRQLTCHMLLDAIGSDAVLNVDHRFRQHWGFGDPLGDPGADEAAYVACGWRAAILRNYSVGAWRSLWRWLALQLSEEPMSVDELGERLSQAFGDMSVADLVGSLPEHASDGALLPAEALIEDDDSTPLKSLRLLVLGAQRLGDLDGPTRKMFVGIDPNDLGPRWVATRLEEWRDDKIDGLARELAQILIRRAKRVSLDKMRLVNGRPWVPSRLRDRDGLLTVHGQEGAGDVSLRTWSLSEILAGLGALQRNQEGAMEVTQLGTALYERTG